MADEIRKPKIELVKPADPTSIFDDLDALRKQERPIIQKHELLTHVPVGNPSSDGYFRVHPDPAMTLPAKIFRLKDDKDRTVYYVPPHMDEHPLTKTRLRSVLLVATFCWPLRQIGIWPVPLDTEGVGASWWESARTAYENAKERWTQMSAGNGHYVVSVAEGDIPDPEWPDRSFSELLKIGLKDRIIDNDAHPVMRRLRGIA
jgi:hypothetical protein